MLNLNFPSSKAFTSKENFKETFTTNLELRFGKSVEESTKYEKYEVLGEIIMAYAMKNWKKTRETVKKEQGKSLYYFSLEFLMGRMLSNNLRSLGLYEVTYDALEELGVDLNEIEDCEAYYGFAGNLDTLSLNSDILFKFSFVVSILLTIFIVSLDLNRRKKEIGLLASLGESKVAIMVQLVLEYLIIIVFTMIIAAFVSNIISNQFIDKIDLNPEVSDIFNDKTLDYSDSISILNNTKLTIDFVDLIKMCLIQTVVILFTIILSAIQIFTIKVRKIMVDE